MKKNYDEYPAITAITFNPIFSVIWGGSFLVDENLIAEEAVLILFVGIEAGFTDGTVHDFLFTPQIRIFRISKTKNIKALSCFFGFHYE